MPSTTGPSMYQSRISERENDKVVQSIRERLNRLKNTAARRDDGAATNGQVTDAREREPYSKKKKKNKCPPLFYFNWTRSPLVRVSHILSTNEYTMCISYISFSNRKIAKKDDASWPPPCVFLCVYSTANTCARLFMNYVQAVSMDR